MYSILLMIHSLYRESIEGEPSSFSNTDIVIASEELKDIGELAIGVLILSVAVRCFIGYLLHL